MASSNKPNSSNKNSKSAQAAGSNASARSGAKGDAGKDKAKPSTGQGKKQVADKKGKKESAAAGANVPESQELHQHHVSNILDEVLEIPAEAPVPGRVKHPVVLDIVLALALLVAAGGFTVSLFKMYVVHRAQEHIKGKEYKDAISLLKGAPLLNFIAIPVGGADLDPQELLNQALYLDGMDKLDNKKDIDGGLNELQQIQAGSRYFALAQEALNDNFEPSSTFLKTGVEKIENNPPAKEEKKPFMPEYPKDASP